MTPEDVQAIAKDIIGLDWQLAIGLAISILYLPIATWMLLKRPPVRDEEDPPDPPMDFYRKWRIPLLGFTFLILGSWAASGAAEIARGFWSTVPLFGIIYLIVLAVRAYKKWLNGIPVPGQVYTIKGVGEVDIIEVSAGATPVEHRVIYEDAGGARRKMSTLQFLVQTRGTLQEDRKVGTTEIEGSP